jgi:hypothetical protein
MDIEASHVDTAHIVVTSVMVLRAFHAHHLEIS